MEVTNLKSYIYKNKKIPDVLEAIGCTKIQYHSNGDYYSCCNKDGDNQGAVNVKNNSYLNVRNWTRPDDFPDKSDIITLVQYNNKCSFPNALKFLHKALNLKYTVKYVPKIKTHDPLDIFYRYNEDNVTDVNDIHFIADIKTEDCTPRLHIDWFREGITHRTAQKFSIGYSYDRHRIIIPHRYWQTGEIVGINARTTIPNNAELGIKKYMLTPKYRKALNVYGLYEHYEDIQEAGYIVVYESEKSVLKRDSLSDKTGVAVSGKIISEEQERILIGQNVEIVIAFDKDVSRDELRFTCEKFYGIRKVSYIYDRTNILGEKDSPADASDKDFKKLFSSRVIYNEEEHKRFLRSSKNE